MHPILELIRAILLATYLIVVGFIEFIKMLSGMIRDAIQWWSASRSAETANMFMVEKIKIPIWFHISVFATCIALMILYGYVMGKKRTKEAPE